MKKTHGNTIFSGEVLQAAKAGAPIVALESAVITHGLPRPKNYELALEMERVVRSEGATPATIALLDGVINVGMTEDKIEMLAYAEQTRKISVRDFGIAAVRKLNGGTTVAASIQIAERVGIRVFATGGIGGVHRNAPFDISADLIQLGRTKVIVVCAGAKAILDMPATLEYLETQGVPVVGYQTDELPAFYSRSSGLKVDISADSPAEVAKIAMAHWAAGLQSSILVVVPPPEDVALPMEKIEKTIQKAVKDAEELGIHGAASTPFLLSRVTELSGGESLKTNFETLLNNGRVAAKIALHLKDKNLLDVRL